MPVEFSDLGNTISLAGASILTSYVSGATIRQGGAPTIRFTATIVTGGGTAITSVDAKVQASSDAITWYDIASVNAATRFLFVEHNQLVSPGSTASFSFACEGSFEYLRAAVKANGGAGSATDTLIVNTEQSSVLLSQPSSLSVLGNSGAALTNVASSASSVTLLSANPRRKGFALYNDSSSNLFLKYGATASSTSFTVKLGVNAYFEDPFAYNGLVTGIWTAANGSARITEVSL